MLAGESPFTGPTPQAVVVKRLVGPVPSVRTTRPDVPPGLDAVLQKALAPVAAARFASVSDFGRALDYRLRFQTPLSSCAPRLLRPAGPLKDLCALGGWKSPQTVLTCYQRADSASMQQALAAGADSKLEYQRTTQRTTWRYEITKMTTPRAPKRPRGDEIAEWAWVELNYRPHAYQAL